LTHLLQMVEVIQWCLELGVSEVSAFAFSIDNFSRPEQEVADLMALVEDKCGELLRVSGGCVYVSEGGEGQLL
jgi:undecaprenyl diphosphate synthase